VRGTPVEQLDRRPAHPLISHVQVPPLSGEAVRRAVSALDDQALPAVLGRLALAGFDELDVDGLDVDRTWPEVADRAPDADETRSKRDR